MKRRLLLCLCLILLPSCGVWEGLRQTNPNRPSTGSQ